MLNGLLAILLSAHLWACEQAGGDTIVTDSYYLHGDSIELNDIPVGFYNDTPREQESLRMYRRAYPFLSCRDSTVVLGEDYSDQYHLLQSEKARLLMYETSGECLLLGYAEITDPRIRIQLGVHVGMPAAALFRLLELPELDRQISHVRLWESGSEYIFDLTGGKLSRIVYRSTLANGAPWPLPTLVEFVEPALLKGDKGPKIFARTKKHGVFDAVCYVDSAGKVVVPYSRGYADAGWQEIGRMGLVVQAWSDTPWLAINHEGRELFHVFGLLDFSPDFVCEGMFRIVEGEQWKGGLIGFADTLGHIRIKPQFRYAYPFRFGRAKVTMTGYVDKSDPEMWEWKSDNWFYIDKNGRRIPGGNVGRTQKKSKR